MIVSTSKFLLRLLAAVTAGSAIVFVVAGWLLWSGPISLQFLTPYVRDALNIGVQGVRIDLEDTILAWADWERTIDIRVRGVRLLDSEDSVIAGVPEMSLGVSGRALLGGRISLTRVDLLGPELRLFRDIDGSFGIGTDDETGRDAGVVVAALLERLQAEPLKHEDTQHLTRASVRAATITIVDKILNQTWRTTDGNISLVRDATSISGTISAVLDLDGVATLVTAKVSHGRDSGEVAVQLELEGMEPRTLASYVPRLEQLSALRTSISGSMELTLGAEGPVGAVEFDFASVAGEIRLPQFFDEDLEFQQVAVKGRVQDNLTAIQVDEMFLDIGPATASLNGLILLDEDLALNLEGNFRDFPVDDLERYWPNSLARKARNWVTTRVRGGVVTRGDVRLAVSPELRVERGLKDEAVDLTFEFNNVSTRYLNSMPKLVEARGSARMSGGEVALVVDSARIGEIAVSEGTVRIEGLNQQHKTAHIGFVGRGEVSDVLSVMDREPYRFAQSIGFNPLSANGLSAARVRFDLPIKSALKAAEVRYVAAANVRDFGVASVMRDHVISDGDLLIQLDGNGITASGTAAIDGAPVSLEWRRAFRPAGPATSWLSLTANLDEVGRERLGLPTAPRVSGTTPVTAQILTKGWEVLEVSATADLTSARLEFPELVWSKAAGTAAEVNLDTAVGGEEGALVTAFELTAPGLTAVGQAELDQENELRRLDLSLLEVGESSVSAAIRPRAPDGFIVALEGGRFDMRPYLTRLFGEEGTLAIPPLVLSMRVGEVILGDRHSLADANGRAVYSGESWQEIEASGVLSGEAPIQISLRTEPGKRNLGVSSSDAGAFVRSLGVFDNAIGGKLGLTATIDESLPSRPLTGQVEIDEFKVVNAPVLARILTIGSLTGMVDLLNGEGISFVRFQAPFAIQDGRLEIDRARAFGPALGITLEGELDQERGQVDLQGTLVPAYTLNSVLGNIPLLGNLLVGKEGEGIFAMTYGVDGPIGEPTVTVNPLSALAPGFLRSIVSGDATPVEELSQDNQPQGE